MTALSLRHVTVEREGHTVLPGVDLELESGEIVALVGPSGCGKSTLLAAVVGVLPLRDGTIELDGRRIDTVPTHQRDITLVPQGQHLFPHLDVTGNIDYGMRRARWTADDRHARVNELLTMTSLDGLGDRRVDQLSGGQAQRVAVARALATRPRLILLDEPLTGLDPELHDRLLVDLIAALRSEHTTAIWVTHDRDEAGRVADRIVRMGNDGSMAPVTDDHYDDVVVPISVEATFDLRRRVLRDGTPTDSVDFDGDAEALHFGVIRSDELVAISSWFRRPHPSRPHTNGYQLRGMASDPRVRGSGAGAVLLTSGMAAVRSLGADHVWARARDTALDFYRHHGFTVTGDGYIDATTDIAHHDIIHTF